MELKDLVKELNLKIVADGKLDVDVTGGYTSDLMSDVLAKATAGDIWITNQKHINAVAVASLLGLAGVVMVGGVEPDENALEKAREENVALFTSDLTAFDVVGRLYSLGVRANGLKVSG